MNNNRIGGINSLVTNQPNVSDDSSISQHDVERYIPSDEGQNPLNQYRDTSLSDRLIEKEYTPISVTVNEFQSLIENKKFDKNAHYEVSGNVDLTAFTEEIELPERLTIIEGHLQLEGCKIKSLPKYLSVKYGEVDCSNCDTLQNLPDTLIAAALNCSGCKRLKDISSSKIDVLSAVFDDCDSLESISGNCDFKEVEVLSLSNCPNFKEISDGVKFNENISFYCQGCKRLETLPENLKTLSVLEASGCTSLKILPENFTVKDLLVLRNCTALEGLPATMSLGGDVYLDGCTGMTTPDWVLRLGRKENGDMRLLVLSSGEPGLRRRLNGYTFQSTEDNQFVVELSDRDDDDDDDDDDDATLEDTILFWYNLLPSDTKLDMPKLSLSDTAAVGPAEVQDYLELLQETADFEDKKVRPRLAQRVVSMLSLLSEEGDLQTRALNIIDGATTSCVDRAILDLNELELLQHQAAAEKEAYEAGSPLGLINMARHRIYRTQVQQIAREHITKLEEVYKKENRYYKIDEIEVELAFWIALQEWSPLSVKEQKMQFNNMAEISAEDLVAAQQRMKVACSDSAVETYLSNWEPWKKFERLQEFPSFEKFPPKLTRQIDECPFIGEKAEQMLWLNDVHVSYEGIRKWYGESGKNPYTNESLKFSEMFRLVDKPSL